VIRRGALVAEWYADGADNTSFGPSWSMAKSFTSALIGIAIEEGLIPGVDVSMADYFPEWAGTPKEKIRLRDVLQMASGLDWNENYDPAAIAESDIIQIVVGEGSHLDYCAARDAAFPPGTRFNYSSGDTMLLSRVIEAATGKRPAEYGREKLFDPLGMDPVDWWEDSAGNTLTYCCLDTPTEDFARFGLLYERGGVWRDAQIVPSAWVTDSVDPSPSYEGYGYKWWLTGVTTKALPPDTYSARGHDGQYIYVIPSLELVVVRNGKYIKYDGPPAADPQLFRRYPSDGLNPELGSFPPDSWSDVELLTPIIDSVTDD
jgi:CubicO group peptidase (beta-lactamase class C family)